jgi:cyclic-di-GMP-binding protein
MLSWINLKRSEHPLEDAQDAKDVAAELATAEPLHALGQISAHLDAVKTAEKLKPARGIEITDLMDRAARVPQRRLNYEYVTLGRRLTRFQENRIWSAVYEYWTQLAEAYRFCLSTYEVGSLGSQALKPHLPKIIARTIRARGNQLKWALMRYDAVDPKIWEDIGRLYSIAEVYGIQSNQVQVYRASQQDSSIERELLRVLTLAVSAPDVLLPVQIEIADRVINRSTGNFQISTNRQPELPFAFDLETPQAPERVSSAHGAPASLRYFGAVHAAKSNLVPLIASLRQHKIIPRDLNLGIHPSTEEVLDTVQHLEKYWCAEPPRRTVVRKHRVEKVMVVHDYEEVVANAGGLFLEYPFVSDDEKWILENEGGGGLGAFVPKPHGAWLRAGSLIALKAEDVAWSIGAVKRVSADRDGNRLVGIQLISTGGTAVTLFPATGTGWADSPEGEICMLLPSENSIASGTVTILLRPGLFDTGAMEMRAHDHRYFLTPLKRIMQGEDFEVAKFSVNAYPGPR